MLTFSEKWLTTKWAKDLQQMLGLGTPRSERAPKEGVKNLEKH